MVELKKKFQQMESERDALLAENSRNSNAEKKRLEGLLLLLLPIASTRWFK